VEDERGVRHITKRILEQAGYTVRIATNGTEGLRRWHEQASQPAQRFDGVITDVVMPDMSGRAMVRAMRAEDPQLRVLFVSGYAEGGLSDEELAGHTAFLAKPFTADALLQEVVGLLGHD
jgi:two-component system cell cycle sensor histidine kinase/response regulator CckA